MKLIKKANKVRLLTKFIEQVLTKCCNDQAGIVKVHIVKKKLQLGSVASDASLNQGGQRGRW